MSAPFTLNQIKQLGYYSGVYNLFKKGKNRESLDWTSLIGLIRTAVFGEGFSHEMPSPEGRVIYYKLEDGSGSYCWYEDDEKEMINIIMRDETNTYPRFVSLLAGWYSGVKNENFRPAKR